MMLVPAVLGWVLGACWGPAILAGSAGADPLERRIAALYRRVASVEPGTAAARDLSQELTEGAHAYLEKGQTGRAIALLEDAYGLDSENGLALAELTLAYVRAENLDFARFYLHLAEQQSPRSPPGIYAVLGEIYYSLNRLDDAIIAWEQYQRLGGADSRALERLARTLQEISLTSGQQMLYGQNFVLHFDSGVPKSVVEHAAEALEEDYREQSRFFHTELSGPQVVILYGGRAYFSLASVPDWVSGVYDGKIRVALDSYGGWVPQLRGVLAHELAHALIRRASRDRAPGWLHEGLAKWWEGERLTLQEMRGAFSRRPPYSLAEMESNLSRKADRAAARGNYVQALGLVQYLIQRSGAGSLACMVAELGEGLTLAAALRQETGLSPEMLLSEWKKWIRL
jgi:tetratricopeptide (TPR) repeat protein